MNVTRSRMVLRVGLALTAAMVPVAVQLGRAGAVTPDARSECNMYAGKGLDTTECVRQVAVARAATLKYRNVLVAILDGFVPMTGCEQNSTGAMGQHWVRADRVVAQGVDPSAPEILLYLPTAAGLKLVGVEYEENALVNGLPYYGLTAPDPASVSPPRAMFGGRVFDGPMQGHTPVQPWHYDLHVWVWETNPSGLFVQYNPALSC